MKHLCPGQILGCSHNDNVGTACNRKETLWPMYFLVQIMCMKNTNSSQNQTRFCNWFLAIFIKPVFKELVLSSRGMIIYIYIVVVIKNTKL